MTSKIYKTKKTIPDDEQYRHEDYLPAIIDRQTFETAQILLDSRRKSNVRASNGRNIHRYCDLIRCADCGSILIAKRRPFRGHDYMEYTTDREDADRAENQ